MELGAYKQLLNIFPEKPDITRLKLNTNVPDNWPFVLVSIQTKSKLDATFTISDSITSISCFTDNPKVVRKLNTFKIGQIIFLYDSKIYKDNFTEQPVIEVGQLYSLKEINDGAKTPVGQEAKADHIEAKPLKQKKCPKKEPTKKKFQKEEKESRWPTLAERWQKQGKI
jgi:hypothetical protein